MNADQPIPPPLDEAAIRARHIVDERIEHFMGERIGVAYCAGCNRYAPCDAIRALDALAQERSRREAAEREYSKAAEAYAGICRTLEESGKRAERAEQALKKISDSPFILCLGDENGDRHWDYCDCACELAKATLHPAQPAAEGE